MQSIILIFMIIGIVGAKKKYGLSIVPVENIIRPIETSDYLERECYDEKDEETNEEKNMESCRENLLREIKFFRELKKNIDLFEYEDEKFQKKVRCKKNPNTPECSGVNPNYPRCYNNNQNGTRCYDDFFKRYPNGYYENNSENDYIEDELDDYLSDDKERQCVKETEEKEEPKDKEASKEKNILEDKNTNELLRFEDPYSIQKKSIFSQAYQGLKNFTNKILSGYKEADPYMIENTMYPIEYGNSVSQGYPYPVHNNTLFGALGSLIGLGSLINLYNNGQRYGQANPQGYYGYLPMVTPGQTPPYVGSAPISMYSQTQPVEYPSAIDTHNTLNDDDITRKVGIIINSSKIPERDKKEIIEELIDQETATKRLLHRRELEKNRELEEKLKKIEDLIRKNGFNQKETAQNNDVDRDHDLEKDTNKYYNRDYEKNKYHDLFSRTSENKREFSAYKKPQYEERSAPLNQNFQIPQYLESIKSANDEKNELMFQLLKENLKKEVEKNSQICNINSQLEEEQDGCRTPRNCLDTHFNIQKRLIKELKKVNMNYIKLIEDLQEIKNTLKINSEIEKRTECKKESLEIKDLACKQKKTYDETINIIRSLYDEIKKSNNLEKENIKKEDTMKLMKTMYDILRYMDLENHTDPLVIRQSERQEPNVVLLKSKPKPITEEKEVIEAKVETPKLYKLVNKQETLDSLAKRLGEYFDSEINEATKGETVVKLNDNNSNKIKKNQLNEWIDELTIEDSNKY